MKKYIKTSYNLDPTGEISEAWETLENAGVSFETLDIVTSLNGYSVKTLNDIARVVFGVDLDDLKSPVEESTKIEASKSSRKSLEEYVGMPFDLNNDEVQYKIAEWISEELLATIKETRGFKRRSFFIDDLSWSSKMVYFLVIEELENVDFDRLPTWDFNCRLNFYDEPSESYEEVESLAKDDIREFIYNIR